MYFNAALKGVYKDQIQGNRYGLKDKLLDQFLELGQLFLN